MKIAIVQVALSHGGAEHVGAMLANGFAQRGHDTIIITDLNQPVVYDIDSQVNICDMVGKVSNKHIKWFKSIRTIRKTIKQNKPDVIIGIMGICTLVTYIACLGLHIPIVMTEHNSFERPKSAPLTLKKKFFKFWINKLYNNITVLTEADKQCIGSRLKNVTVLPNPLLLKPVNVIPQKERIVLAAGRVDSWHYKGFDVLIKSWKKNQDLNDNVNDDDNLREWWLKIAGAGKKESFEYLMDLLPDGNWIHNENDNENENWFWRSEKYHIEFLGFQKDMESLYKKSEIFVLSSRYEGFGLVLIEAMSQGCACIACDYKDRQREIIQNDNQGLCCKPDNVEMLANAIQQMIIDDDYRKNVQQNAIERSKFYNLDNIIKMWEDYLVNVR